MALFIAEDAAFALDAEPDEMAASKIEEPYFLTF